MNQPKEGELFNRMVKLDPSFSDLPDSYQRELILSLKKSSSLLESLSVSESDGRIARPLYDLIQTKMNREFRSEPECEREFHYQEYLRFLEERGDES